MRLTDFVRAQLDRDERIALAAHGPVDGPLGKRWWSPEDIKTRLCDDQIWMADAEHMALHGPARVLQEIDAKRQLLTAHTPGRPQGRPGMEAHCLSCTTAQVRDDVAGESNCLTLRLLAMPYADQPGFREEWRP